MSTALRFPLGRACFSWRRGPLALIAASVALLAAVALGPLGAAAAATPTSAVTSLASPPCGTHLVVPGRYRLMSDVGPCPADGIVIDAPGVSLDLGGHTVTGSKTGLGGGIVLSPTAVGSRVANGTVVGFGTGVEDDASLSLVTGMRAFSNVGIGVYVYNAAGARVTRSWANENGRFGYYLQRADRTLLVHDQGEFNGIYGLWIQSSSHNRILDNGFTDNGRSIPTTLAGGGIYLGCSNHGVFPPEGECAGTSDGNLLKGNIANENFGFGIAIDRGNVGNAIVANTALHNRGTDLVDTNPCGANRWARNTFGTRNASCIH